MKPRSISTWIWNLATRVAAACRPHPAPDQIARHDWPTDTRRMGLRFSERLRDAWRPRWLRLRRHD